MPIPSAPNPARHRDDSIDLSSWVGKTEVREDLIAPGPAMRLLATLDDVDTGFSVDSHLPPLWHWLYFLPGAPRRELGTDGHPSRGGFLPPIELPRRMFAGGRFRFHSPLAVGHPARRSSEIVSVERKRGRSGPLVFVRVRHRVLQHGRLCVEEVRDIVYRGYGTPPAAPIVDPRWAPAPEGTKARIIDPDPVMLFRFSALTFNAHRIHYDQPYAREVEGYPGLLVHGPLLAILLMEYLRRDGTPVGGFTFRARAPLFCGVPFRVLARSANGRVALWAEGPDGNAAVEAEAIVEPPRAPGGSGCQADAGLRCTST